MTPVQIRSETGNLGMDEGRMSISIDFGTRFVSLFLLLLNLSEGTTFSGVVGRSNNLKRCETYLASRLMAPPVFLVVRFSKY